MAWPKGKRPGSGILWFPTADAAPPAERQDLAQLPQFAIEFGAEVFFKFASGQFYATLAQ